MKPILLPIILMSIYLAGCASTPEDMTFNTERSIKSTDRLTIRSASLRIEVDNTDSATKAVTKDIESMDGYVDHIYRRDDKSVSLTVKLPETALEELINKTSGLGVVKSKSLSAKDVTDEITDIEARLKNLYVLRDRFRLLLDKADTVSEVIDIERELSRIQTEIDSIEGRRLKLKNQVAYSEAEIYIDQKTIYGPLGYAGYGLYWLAEKMFVIQ